MITKDQAYLDTIKSRENIEQQNLLAIEEKILESILLGYLDCSIESNRMHETSKQILLQLGYKITTSDYYTHISWENS